MKHTEEEIYLKGEELEIELVDNRFTKKELLNILNNKFGKAHKELSEIDESGCVSDYAFIYGIEKEYGYIDIYFLKVPYGEEEIFITEISVSVE